LLRAPILQMPLQRLVNDGLMSLFFLLAALEIRRELTEGHLQTLRGMAAPGIAAIGGIIVPAAIYLSCTHGNHAAAKGWAIPVATDIAFSLAVLRLVGGSARRSLRVFLTALAILDDLGAIVVIAIFYGHGISWPYGLAATGLITALLALRRTGVAALWPYLACGPVLWVLVYDSGVHATLAGVALAFVLPVNAAERLENGLSDLVGYLVLPIFGLANAGVDFGNLHVRALLSPAPLGVVLGLGLGKPIGVFAAATLGRRLRWLKLPEGVTTGHLLGAALLCGIGFTMSLFIGNLAFAGALILTDVKLAIFCASLVSAIAGFIVLKRLNGRP
jgi:NhaA family Na+:H+ antiporter